MSLRPGRPRHGHCFLIKLSLSLSLSLSRSVGATRCREALPLSARTQQRERSNEHHTPTFRLALCRVTLHRRHRGRRHTLSPPPTPPSLPLSNRKNEAKTHCCIPAPFVRVPDAPMPCIYVSYAYIRTVTYVLDVVYAYIRAYLKLPCPVV